MSRNVLFLSVELKLGAATFRLLWLMNTKEFSGANVELCPVVTPVTTTLPFTQFSRKFNDMLSSKLKNSEIELAMSTSKGLESVSLSRQHHVKITFKKQQLGIKDLFLFILGFLKKFY